jgi:glycosyltransferase involved in cell wall biosynthesis
LKPLVSVIMPVYNGQDYLSETIQSILNQTFGDFEFIIIDDGSQDGSEGVVLSFRDHRIRFLRNETNRGTIFTLNRGIAAATGQYIARTDADDVAEPDRFQKQLDFLHQHDDYGLCGTFYRIIDSKGRETRKVKLPMNDRELRTYLLFGNCFCHSSIMIRASLARTLQYDLDFELCEDYDLWSRISAHHKLGNLPLYAVGYRVHGNNISVKNRDKMLASVKKIHERGLNRYHIPFSSGELILHSAFLSFDHAYCAGQGFDKVEEWAVKLARYINNRPEIDDDLALKVIIRRWVTNCYNAGEYKRLFDNLLLKEYGTFYLKCLGEKVLDKWTGRDMGYDL